VVGRRLSIAYVSAQLPSYLASEHEVVLRSLAALRALAAELDVDLVDDLPVVTDRRDAERAADAAAAAGADLVLLQCSTFAMGDVVLPFVDRPFRLGLWAADEPVRSGPIPLNAFVAMHLHAGVVRALGPAPRARAKWFVGLGDHPWFAPRLRATVAALRGVHAVSGARIGLVGGVAPTFFNVASDAGALRARFGVEVVDHEVREVVAAARAQPPAEVDALVAELRAAARGRVEVDAGDLRGSAAVALALRGLAARAGYRALAVSDWPVFQAELGLHPGMAFSWLDEADGLPIASEGDVLGALSMLLARGLSGAGAMLLDMNDVDLDADALLMWHCGGSPLNFADGEGVRWTNHTTLGRKTPGARPRGAVADLRFRHGPATVLRLGRDGRELFAVDAEVVAHPTAGFDGSRGWLSGFRDPDGPRTVGDVVATVVGGGVEHHFALAEGHVAGPAREAAAWLGVGLTPWIPYRDHLEPGGGVER